ncbi:NUDIX domain-containing protein [Gordonia sp. HY002]|uniref:NUDIX hydrolase n=1 Tax=Gordonia zhenghanii TaxID=2911516 RepID=UPI001EF07FF6|nr:NUDIX domain-containing protein [Gordonia zhenghanii]MCF8571444.1 NUDIX domain-containing protein [Gordonia zhenghanii]MCF8607697.1 NUDIX domain-containing protein [Gordonia zhenghanii]
MSITDATRAILADWTAPDAEQDALRHTMLAFVDAADDPCMRACVPGHVTGSVIVFDATLRHVLLTLHPRVGKWIQLGGHCEPDDASVAATAAREGLEESGLPSLRLSDAPVHLHTHPITCSLGVPTRHLDVRYAAVADPTPDGSLPAIVRSDESVDLAWWPVDDLPADIDADTIPVLIESGAPALKPLLDY